MRFYSETGASALTTAQIIPFQRRRPVIRNCSRCGGHFRSTAPHHIVCRVCYYWRRALLGIAISNQAFEALRSGGNR